MCLRLIARSIPSFKSGRGQGQENGNVFLAIFGAIALVGLLGASVMTFMKGPLATSVRLTKMNTAENQMAIGAQVAVMATASQSNNGDCETAPDGYVEPIEWRAATTEPHPVNGGLVPLTLGINKKDPWGTEYGYCVWNHGPTTSGAGCGANMLAGTNAKTYPVVALISAGPDKTFTTTCRTFAAADVNSDGDLLDATDLTMVSKAAETDDDVITTFTYDEATGASGGLWNLKTGDPSTAVISKKIEASGVASLKGGVLLPDKSLITCDASTAGVMAKNGTTGIEICDGSGAWTAISGGAAVVGGGLVLTPNVSTGMNVTGTCGTATCYSSNITFAVTNNLSPAAASAVLGATLSNTTNFEFVSNGCNGVSIPAGGNCQMVVRAKATGNLSYAGTLNITGNNSPFATLDGTAASFPGCNAGGQTTGGYYVGCSISGYNLIVTPSGCTSGATNPTCAGGADTLALQPNYVNTRDSNFGVGTSSDGAQNTADELAYASPALDFPAASWCDQLVYQGYSDWFLPSFQQFQSYIWPNRTAVNMTAGSTTAYYATSTVAAWYRPLYMTYVVSTSSAITSTNGQYSGSGTALVRCARWDPAKTITPVIDTTPDSLVFNPSYGAASETRTSNAVGVYGITKPVSISISGGTNAKFSINGGAYTSTSTTVVAGDQITLQATSPLVGGQDSVSLTVGTQNITWMVRTPGNNKIRVFTTSSTYTGNLGGPGGADTTCTSVANAAGLTGNWTAVIVGASLEKLENRLPWNWNRLENLNGQLVANNLTDFMDGSISAKMNYTQTGALSGSGVVWSGVSNGGSGHGDAYWNMCQSFSSNSPSGCTGDTSTVSSGQYFYNGVCPSCGSSYRLLCMESNAAGADLDPDEVSIRPQAIFASGGTGTSNTITVKGVTDIVTVTIAPSSGTADIIKGGVSVGAMTTTAGLNETIAFTMTAPTTLGTKNTATITIGPDTYTWWVGYADAAKEAKVFVTSGSTSTNFGGISGADSICNSYAASSSKGLSSAWVAMISDSANSMSARIPWNWGTLKTLSGTVVVDGGYSDLLDGTFDTPINVNENGITATTYVFTGTNAYGDKYSPSGTTSYNWAYDWTNAGCVGWFASIGLSTSTTAGLYYGGDGCNNRALYCIENIDSTVLDTTPVFNGLTYPVQVATGSRQTSNTWTVSGMSTGATTTLSVTATGGTPTFTINGGAEVTSGVIRNGDSIVFKMDAPATGNTSNRMTIKVNSGADTIGYWRVWTGDTTGTVVKRIFVTPTTGNSTDTGGVSGVDSQCQSRASAASLGGTWKALVSGYGNSESEWAVNRIGYNWTKLQRIDGADVVYAGNIWNSTVTPLINPVTIRETGATLSTSYVRTGTTVNGMAAVQTANGQCNGFTMNSSYSATNALYNGTSGTTGSGWINNGNYNADQGYGTCHYYYFGHLYCIEQ